MEPSTHNCNICKKSFSAKRFLLLHAKTHSEGQREKGADQYVCQKCGKVTKTKQALERHMAYHESDRPHSCEICLQRFKNTDDKGKHYRRLKRDGKFEHACRVCHKHFKSDDLLQRHLLMLGCGRETNPIGRGNSMHNDKVDEIEDDTTKETDFVTFEDKIQCTCKTCGIEFEFPEALKCHYKDDHKDTKKHVCLQCGQTLSSKDSLSRHHSIFHQTAHPYECDICKMKFKIKEALCRHVKFVHKDGGYICDVCHKTFSQPVNLKKHMAVHSSHKEYKCDKCGKEFRWKQAILKHVKKCKNNGESSNSKSFINRNMVRAESNTDPGVILNLDDDFSAIKVIKEGTVEKTHEAADDKNTESHNSDDGNDDKDIELVDSSMKMADMSETISETVGECHVFIGNNGRTEDKVQDGNVRGTVVEMNSLSAEKLFVVEKAKRKLQSESVMSLSKKSRFSDNHDIEILNACKDVQGKSLQNMCHSGDLINRNDSGDDTAASEENIFDSRSDELTAEVEKVNEPVMASERMSSMNTDNDGSLKQWTSSEVAEQCDSFDGHSNNDYNAVRKKPDLDVARINNQTTGDVSGALLETHEQASFTFSQPSLSVSDIASNNCLHGQQVHMFKPSSIRHIMGSLPAEVDSSEKESKISAYTCLRKNSFIVDKTSAPVNSVTSSRIDVPAPLTNVAGKFSLVKHMLSLQNEDHFDKSLFDNPLYNHPAHIKDFKKMVAMHAVLDKSGKAEKFDLSAKQNIPIQWLGLGNVKPKEAGAKHPADIRSKESVDRAETIVVETTDSEVPYKGGKNVTGSSLSGARTGSVSVRESYLKPSMGVSHEVPMNISQNCDSTENGIATAAATTSIQNTRGSTSRFEALRNMVIHTQNQRCEHTSSGLGRISYQSNLKNPFEITSAAVKGHAPSDTSLVSHVTDQQRFPSCSHVFQ